MMYPLNLLLILSAVDFSRVRFTAALALGDLSDFDFFSDIDVSDNDIFSTFPEEDQSTLMTDATLGSPCATEQGSLTDDQSLFVARDVAECLPPVPLPPPLTQGTLQLFQDPLDSLNEIFPSSGEDSSDPFGYLGLILAPEKQKEKEKEQQWDTERYGGDALPTDENSGENNPCQPYVAQGYGIALCCGPNPAFLKHRFVSEYQYIKSCDSKFVVCLPSFLDVCCMEHWVNLRLGRYCIDFGGAS